MPSVSVIVPVYNPGEYLVRCLDSLAAQTWTDWECILVDDGSSDGSSDICDCYAARDSRFRVIHQKNAGASAARNQGLACAHAPYIAMLDADDCFAPQTLEILLNAQQAHPDSLVFFSYTHDPSALGQAPDGPLFSVYQKADIGRLIQEAPFPTPWGKLFCRSLLENVPIRFDPMLTCYEDRPFMRAYLRSFWDSHPNGSCILLNTPLYLYEMGNQNSLSKSDRSKLSSGIWRAFSDQLSDCIHLYNVEPYDLGYLVREYLNALLYSIWCTPQPERRRAVKEFYSSEAYRELTDYFCSNRLFEVRWAALRLHITWLAVLLDRSRLNRMWLYWKCHCVCVHSFFRGWRSLV